MFATVIAIASAIIALIEAAAKLLQTVETNDPALKAELTGLEQKLGLASASASAVKIKAMAANVLPPVKA